MAGLTVSVSYDDGKTWTKRPVRDGDKGHYQAVLDSPDPADTATGCVSLKVEAWDAADNRVEQEVIRAWRLAER